MTASSEQDQSKGPFLRLQNRKPFELVLFSFTLLICCLAVFLVIQPVFYPDTAEYLSLVDSFRIGAYDRAFPKHLPVLTTLLAGIPAKCGIPPLSALLIVSSLLTALTVFPLYGLLKKCVPTRLAAWGALLFVFFPEILRIGIAPLTDSLRFFLIILGLYLIFSEKKSISLKLLVFLGLTYAGLILGRAEGILYVGILFVIHMLRLHHLRSRESRKDLLRAAAAVFIPVLVALPLLLPRMIQMAHETGYPAIDQRQSNAIGEVWRTIFPPEEEKSCPAPESKANTPAAPAETAADPAQKPAKTVVSYENDGGRGWVSLDPGVLFRQWDFYRSFPASFFWLYLPFTLLGLILWIRRKKHAHLLKMMLVMLFLYNLMFFILRGGIMRYLLLNVCFAMPFTLLAFRWIRLKISARFPRGVRGLAIFPVLMLLVMIAYFTILCIFCTRYESFKDSALYFYGKSSRNPEVDRPVILMIGDDLGIGYHAQVNVIRYTKLGLDQTTSLREILQQGVSTKYHYFWLTKNMPDHVRIDAVVINTRSPAELEILRSCTDLLGDPVLIPGHKELADPVFCKFGDLATVPGADLTICPVKEK